VLLVELTGSNTELAKNLILSGANISIFDDNTINEQDVDTNFLFGKHEIGLSVI
jgi:molybdopterin/thiamine biosynthesis adenylyltransferase